MKPSVAIVGCGRVGTALALFLNQAGYPIVALASKSPASAAHLAEKVGCKRFGTEAGELCRAAEQIVLTPPDSRIASVCQAIAKEGGFADGAVVLHCSGALSSKILEAAKAQGAHTGSLHPLQSFASRDFVQNPFAGIIISAEGDPQAVEAARAMTADLGAVFETIRTHEKALYHAAAVVASNYLVTLAHFSFDLLDQAGISGDRAFDVLAPLIRGTLTNIEHGGPVQALTGPVARGDTEIVQNHLDALGEKAPQWLALYKALGRHTVELAEAKGSLSAEVAERFKGLFADG